MASQTFKQEVVVDGKTLIVEGTVGIGDLKVTVKTDSPPPPPPPPDVDPNTGTIKEGARWSKNAGPADTWEAVAMTDESKKGLWKIITHSDNDLNVIADIPSKETALQLIEYFKTHKFPPEDQTPPPPPPPPPDGGNGGGGGTPIEGKTVEGVTIPYEPTGKVRTDDWYYNENNGLRVDYEKNTNPAFVNNVMVIYGKFVGKVTEGEERAFKWTQGRHSKEGDIANCYIVAIRNGDGKTRVRFEKTHPSGYTTWQDYDKTLAAGKPAKTGETWGMMGVRKDTPSGVLLELYEDTGVTGGDGKPANQWKKLISYEDKDELIKDYSDHGIEVTCRCDDDIGDKNIQIQKALLVEIKA